MCLIVLWWCFADLVWQVAANRAKNCQSSHRIAVCCWIAGDRFPLHLPSHWAGAGRKKTWLFPRIMSLHQQKVSPCALSLHKNIVHCVSFNIVSCQGFKLPIVISLDQPIIQPSQNGRFRYSVTLGMPYYSTLYYYTVSAYWLISDGYLSRWTSYVLVKWMHIQLGKYLKNSSIKGLISKCKWGAPNVTNTKHKQVCQSFMQVRHRFHHPPGNLQINQHLFITTSM